MNKPKKKLKCYLIRDLPQPLWTQARHIALTRGIPMRTLLLEALEKYVEDTTGDRRAE